MTDHDPIEALSAGSRTSTAGSAAGDGRDAGPGIPSGGGGHAGELGAGHLIRSQISWNSLSRPTWVKVSPSTLTLRWVVRPIRLAVLSLA